MSTISRRAILAGTATLPAIAIPSLAHGAPNPDAELLALGAQINSLRAEWLSKRAIDAARRNAFDAKVQQATGIAFKDAPQPERDENGDWTNAYWQARDRLSEEWAGDRDEVDEHGCSVVWESIHDRMFPLVDDILSRTPQTVAGLAVLVRAVIMARSELWEWHGGEDHERQFIEAVCAFVGLNDAALLMT